MGIDVVMWAVTEAAVTDEQITEWAGRLDDAFDLHPPVLGRADGRDVDGSGADGQTVLEVWNYWRYYGPDYARGPFSQIYMLAEWLERNIPGATAWYGGDTGAYPDPWPAEERERFKAFFCEYGHRPYRGAFRSTRR